MLLFSLELPEMWVQSLCWEDSLEKGMTTHFSILAWKIPWTEEPEELQSMGSQESDTTEHAPLDYADSIVLKKIITQGIHPVLVKGFWGWGWFLYC